MAVQVDELQEPRSAAPAAPGALPCLYRNNSDRTAEQSGRFQAQTTAQQARTRKAAFSLAANVEHFVEQYGIDNVGFVTITFEKRVADPKEAQRRFNNFGRRVLGELFGDRIRVLESHADGRPHYHLLVDCRGDIRTGFDWDYYQRVVNRRAVGDYERPKGSLNRTPLLKFLHDRINEVRHRYGIGRTEVVPIRSSSEAVGRYVGGYISKGAIWRDERYKGARTVSYSQSFTRKVKGAFAWVEHGRKWREAVSTWAESHGCADLDQVKSVFGPRWAYHHGESILAQADVSTRRTEPESTRALGPSGHRNQDPSLQSPTTTSGTSGKESAGTTEGTAGIETSGEDQGGGGPRPAGMGAKRREYVLQPSDPWVWNRRMDRVQPKSRQRRQFELHLKQ